MGQPIWKQFTSKSNPHMQVKIETEMSSFLFVQAELYQQASGSWTFDTLEDIFKNIVNIL